MPTVTIKVTGKNEHDTIRALADATVDLEWRGFNKANRLIINKVNGEFVFTQEFRRDSNGNSSQCIRDNEELEKV